MTRVSCKPEAANEEFSSAQSSSCCDCPCYLRDDADIGHGHSELTYGDIDASDLEHSVESSDTAVDQRRRYKAYREIRQGYDQIAQRIESLKEAKSRILSYTPGAWLEKAGSIKVTNYNVPKKTTLIVIGPKGSGKSSLINRITKVIEGDQFAPERAQVSYGSSSGEGTFFLHEYMIPRGSSSFCLYDTRGFNDNHSDFSNTIKEWTMRGVRHGELITWKSDSSNLRDRLKQKARRYKGGYSQTRTVNYVIFVVNGLEVLKSMKGENLTQGSYNQMVAAVFSSPYLSFKDDKPAVVITHGDILSVHERTSVRHRLGELLGIPPDKQIFDIPDSFDPSTELTVVDMLRYSLEHADKNLETLGLRNRLINKAVKMKPWTLISLVIILGVALMLGYMQNQQTKSDHKPEAAEMQVDWSAIRHMWFGAD